MSDERVDLDAFLEELVATLDRRLRKQEKRIEALEKALLKGGKTSRGIDRSVLRVLRGK